MGSCNGLLCLFDPIVEYVTHILNPCTGEFVFLPDPIRDLEDPVSVVVGFRFLHNRNVYKVVEIVYYKREIVDDDNDDLRFVDRIVAFDLQNEVFGVIPHPDFDSGRLNYTLGVLQDYVEIWVMKDYGVKESWTKRLKIVCSEVGLVIGAVQPLFFQRNGEVILQHDGTLLCYNPLTKKLRELPISGMPRSFKAFIHVGSLVSPRKLLKGSSAVIHSVLAEERRMSKLPPLKIIKEGRNFLVLKHPARYAKLEDGMVCTRSMLSTRQRTDMFIAILGRAHMPDQAKDEAHHDTIEVKPLKQALP
ncbi:hypothetical protein RND71_018404 [Anisodus tanguticus]|uniref:F-box associated domain-containing protein n=1 Tax=Anisodus tanguticus TaxID=243964 RepID=A0AAE1S453_9SOLA|nr:hypothetical protein RND71_018404 [Anisodus tanguticus]